MQNFNFNKLSAVELQKNKITHAEIVSAHDNKNAIWYSISGFPLNECYYFFIGFTQKFRFLLVYLNYDQEDNTIVFHQIKIVDEKQIQELYCKGRFSRISKRDK
jgi:hypothetical protein